YFALGDEETVEAGAAYLRDYYRFTGGFEERIAAGNLTTPAAIKDLVRGYEEEGCHELVLPPTVSPPDQLDRPPPPLRCRPPPSPRTPPRPPPRGPSLRAQPAGRHLRLGRRLLRGLARRAGARRLHQLRRDHGGRGPVEPPRRPLPRHDHSGARQRFQRDRPP